MMSTEEKQVAQTILNQIGGNRFMLMTGSKVQSLTVDSITFRLTRNKANAGFLKITLTPADTYTLEFTKVRKFELIPVETLEDIYFDQLEEVFTRVTGLYTRF